MITNEEYIRKAVELADGWRENRLGNVQTASLTRNPISLFARAHKDALAAQLVRQVDALDAYSVVIYEEETLIGDIYRIENIASGYSQDDRTMNTIKAIVDSGVLEKESE